IARDFQTMCYYQSPNRIESEALPIGNPNCPGPGCLRFTRLGYPQVLCCVGNVNRIIPNYIIHMWMATHDGGLAATLYGPCTVHALAGDRVPVKLDCQTAYPFADSIRIQVTPAQKASFPLYFRIPGWCHEPRLAVNGTAIKNSPDEQGFMRIERSWRPGDTVTLKVPMSVRIDRGYADEYPAANREYYGYLPKAVFDKKRLPYESICYGPLLFALPIPDLDPNTPAPNAAWQFALDNNPEKEGRDIVVERHSMPRHWDWPLAAPIDLKAPAEGFAWNPTMTQPLPNDPVSSAKGGKNQMITLVPYGCTKFRISMFPVTQKAWENVSILPK
ncbi:MAG TPA: hypothetical protein VL970_01395, partial [Candidatus Acidoferrales bacterium]|nr:hypothetical protein [Candidatus Acidoferrales bacterium]